MCEPTSTTAIVLGAASAIFGTIGTVAQYSQQQQQADAANQQAFNAYAAQNRQAEAIASQRQAEAMFNLQNYNNQVELQNQRALNDFILGTQQTMTANMRLQSEFLTAQTQRDFTNLQNQLQFTANMNRAILSEERAETQMALNQQGLSSQLEAAQQRYEEAKAVRAFEAERLMASSIRSQGTVLASGRSGQSIGLAINDLSGGRDLRMAERNLASARGDFYTESTNAFLTQAQKDAEAIASIMPKPMQPLDLPDIAPPVFGEAPPKPVFAPFSTNPGPTSGAVYGAAPTPIGGPSPLGLVAGIGGAMIGGYQTYAGINSMVKTPQQLANQNPGTN